MSYAPRDPRLSADTRKLIAEQHRRIAEENKRLARKQKYARYFAPALVIACMLSAMLGYMAAWALLG